jgi:hypothetical protein
MTKTVTLKRKSWVTALEKHLKLLQQLLRHL